ncbi:hypothetical protein DL769_002558 [Monosporascus sp. CRB-8-3]|nr:hypothetical protein DL769_002558 [Monosporascus sp. CRB-8-3]
MSSERTSRFLKVMTFLDFLVKLAATGALYGILVLLLNILNEIRRMNSDGFWNVAVDTTDTFRVALVADWTDAIGGADSPIAIRSV